MRTPGMGHKTDRCIMHMMAEFSRENQVDSITRSSFLPSICCISSIKRHLMINDYYRKKAQPVNPVHIQIAKSFLKEPCAPFRPLTSIYIKEKIFTLHSI